MAPIYSHIFTVTIYLWPENLKFTAFKTPFPSPLHLININNLIVMRKQRPRKMNVLLQVYKRHGRGQTQDSSLQVQLVPHHPTPSLY